MFSLIFNDFRLPEIQREEKCVQKAIKDVAKQNDMQSAKVTYPSL